MRNRPYPVLKCSSTNLTKTKKEIKKTDTTQGSLMGGRHAATTQKQNTQGFFKERSLWCWQLGVCLFLSLFAVFPYTAIAEQIVNELADLRRGRSSARS